jgi:hypothetical protein
MKAPEIPPLLLLTAAPLLGLAANVVLQILLGRISLSVGPIRRQLFCFACGFAVAAVCLVRLLPAAQLTPWDQGGYAALHLVSYVLLGFLFFNVINLNVSSLRIRMLREYAKVDPQPLSESMLRERFSARRMLDARLERLAAGGQLVERESRYFHRPGTVVLIGRIFAFLQRILLGK